VEQNIVILLSLLIILASILVIILLPRRSARLNEPTTAKIGEAVDADVLALENISESDNGTVLVSVQLRVYPTDDSPYETQTAARIWRVDIPHLQPGRTIPVRIDPEDRDKVVVDLDIA
jgi:hypothetical protein